MVFVIDDLYCVMTMGVSQIRQRLFVERLLINTFASIDMRDIIVDLMFLS